VESTPATIGARVAVVGAAHRAEILRADMPSTVGIRLMALH
jgi:hypothetical protein